MGMKLQRNASDEIEVQGMEPGGAAAAGGVKANDVIECIDGKSTLGLTVRDVVRPTPLPLGPRPCTP